jgi:three-Cys-motif partner protein
MPKLDLSNYDGREQAYVKHYLLEKYLSRWGYKIGSIWNPLVFIDGFAGPWGAKDKEFADASFGIGLRALNEAVDGLFQQRGITIRGLCVFVENKPKPFARLEEFAKKHSTDRVRAVALKGRFIDHTKRIDEEVAAVGANPFKFVFLDQKGWAATPMANLKPFVTARPCELLFNLMTSFLTRFVDRVDLTASYHALYGREEAINKIRSLPKGTGQREEMAVEEYCKSLREICGFNYVSQAIVMDPKKEKVRYYLVFATNSLHGIQVFKSAEAEAAETQNEVRYESRIKSEGPFLPFGGPPPKSPKLLELHQRYVQRARVSVINVLSNEGKSVFTYEEVYGRAMAFPLVTPGDLESLILELEPAVQVQLEGKGRKKPLLFRKDRIVVINSKALV